MVTTGLQVVGFILGCASWAGMVATTVSPKWRRNTVAGTVLEEHHRSTIYPFLAIKISFISNRTLKISDLMVFGFNVKKCRMEIRTVTNIPGFLLGYPVSFSFFTYNNLHTMIYHNGIMNIFQKSLIKI